MKAFVDGNMIGLVNDDFVNIQESDVVWVERIDMPVIEKCPYCGEKSPLVGATETICPSCMRIYQNRRDKSEEKVKP